MIFISTMIWRETEDAMNLEWELTGVTAEMIDWFWSNMEKCNLLWHPAQHEPLQWARAPRHGNPVGSIHIAPQTWNDGSRQNLYLQWQPIDSLPPALRKYITHTHALAVSCIGLGEKALTDPEIWGYRVHQWTPSDKGVKGRSTAFGVLKQEDHDDKVTWGEHCQEEIGNWEIFLPTLFQLYRVVTNTDFNPYANLEIEPIEDNFRYRFIP